MKVLFNGASVAIGGGIQAAAAFLVRAATDPRCANWKYVLSEPLARQLAPLGIDIRTPDFDVVTGSPARSRATRARLRDAESRFQPDLVFTFFGPSYVRFRKPHLCGVADGWVTHSSSLAYSALGSRRAQLFMLALCFYKGLWFRQADRWLVEAESARGGLSKRLRIAPSRITIVQNTCAAHYLEPLPTQAGTPQTKKPNATKRILIFAAYYPHKNIEIAPRVAEALERLDPALDFEIVLTIRADSEEWRHIRDQARALGVGGRVRTIGPVDVVDGPFLYASADVVLHPSLLETFSATYPESMAMETPIVATDLAFARDVCRDAALYYSPLDAQDAAAKIHGVLASESLRKKMTDAGARVLQTLPAPAEKFEKIMACIHAGPTERTSVSAG